MIHNLKFKIKKFLCGKFECALKLGLGGQLQKLHASEAHVIT